VTPAIALNLSRSCPDAAAEGCAGCRVRPVSICSVLDAAELSEFESLSEQRSFRAKETIARQGEKVDAVYNLTGGVARLYKLLPDGRRQIVGFLLPGDFLGLVASEQYGFSVDVIEPVTACRFSRAAFLAFLDRKPHLLRRLLDAAANELALAQDHMVLLGRRTAEEKLLWFLLNLRIRWARVSGTTSVTVPLPMSRSDVADHLGLTIETVSRSLTRLARDKLIVIVPNGVRLLDLTKIEAMAAA
jgi:CRP/FNR family transcriptional regulator, anaerobic regulatory protein